MSDATLKAALAARTMPAASELVRAEKDGLRCFACGHRCFIRPGGSGVCRVRGNVDGTLMVPSGYVAAIQIDPIEKKPFYHAFPGRDALSFGMLGCDLHCSYCQNWVTSQALRDDAATAPVYEVGPKDLVALAVRHGTPVVVSTYNEPLITAEWAVQVFAPARAAGLHCAFVSNGNATPEVLDYLKPFVSLYKVDLKGFTDKGYRSLGCKLSNVLESIQRLKAMGFWVEIVTLVIPGFNDSEEELNGIAKFIAGVSPEIPWHVTAFHPDYHMRDRDGTPVETLLRAFDLGKAAGLHFVYPGNLHGHVGERENTCCPGCGETLIRRRGFYVLENRMDAGRCPKCGLQVPGVWEANAPVHSTGTGIPRAVRV